MKKLDITVTMDNGDVFEVSTKMADYLLFETTAKRHKWGGIGDNPALWETFLGWAAVRRVGKYSGTWEQFTKEVDLVEAKPPEDVDPTQSVVGDASS